VNLSLDLIAALQRSEFVKNLVLNHEVQIDNSTHENWDACLAKGLFGGALKRNLKRGEAPLRFGGAVHKGLEHLYRGAPIEEAIQHAVNEAQENDLASVADEKRNITRLKDLIAGYHGDMIIRPDKLVPIRDSRGELLIEQSFSFPIGTITAMVPETMDFVSVTEQEISVFWQGRIDMIAKSKSDGRAWIVDFKTTSVMGEKFADDKHRSNQMQGYTWAGRTLEEPLGLDLSGVMIDAIAMRARGFEYKRFPLPVAKWKTEEWEQEILFSMQGLVEGLTTALCHRTLAPTRSSCVTKYGKCPFFQVCEAHPRMRDSLLWSEDDYYTSTWSPLTS
jgi:hypothetical protein